MARVNQLIEKSIQRPTRHRVVDASYSVVEVDGQKLLQIDSYGAADRQIPGKTSQSLQFGPEGIAELRKILSKFD